MAEWCTIESDPGVFTELIKNIGVKGVQVDEVIDLELLQSEHEPVYGLIFLFKYVRKGNYTPNILKVWDQDLYFAKQVIVNACATQAILAILMNNEERIQLGEDILNLKNFTKEMDPQMKGLSISNCDKIKNEHNKFSHPEPFVFSKKRAATDDDDVFHFVAYIHHRNSIYEIDGLREGPILIRENVTFDNWVIELTPSITARINSYANSEIKFNLMALVPDRLEKAKEVENHLMIRKNYITHLLSGKEKKEEEMFHNDYNNLSKEDLTKSLNRFENQIASNRMIIEDEEYKVKKCRIENERRQHNYIPLIFEILKLMSEKGKLEGVYEDAKKLEEEKQAQKNNNNTNANKQSK